MPIDPFDNGDGGGSIRAKINEVISRANAHDTALDGKAPLSHTHTVPFWWLDFLNYDPTLGSNSSEEVPVVSAVKGYADGKLAKSGGTMTGPITLAADAASALQPVTKQQLEAALINMGKRQRVRAKTTANVNLGGGLVAGASVDGVTVALGDLVLVASQTAAAENGVYAVPTSGSAPRAAEFDSWDEHPGSIITVAEGSTQADTLWLCIANGGGTLDTTAIDWSPLRVSGELLAANNLSDLGSPSTARSNLGSTTVGDGVFTAADAAAGRAALGAAAGDTHDFSGNVNVGTGAGTGTASLRVGGGRSGNGAVVVDLISDTTYTTYGARLIRNGGPNGGFAFYQRGTGGLSFQAQDGANISFLSNAVIHTRFADTGDIQMGAGVNTVITASRHHLLRSYTVATLPSATPACQMIYVSDGAGNKRLAVSDATNWRFADGAIVS